MPATASEVEEFVARHWALAHRLIGARAWRARDVDRDDARSDGLLALWEAARTHDPSKGGEVAHVVRTVSWRLIDGHRERNGRPDREGRRLPPLQLDDNLSRVLANRADPIGDRVDILAIHQVLNALPDRHRDILVARFLDGRALADIGRERGFSESRACVLVKAALKAATRVASGLPISTRPVEVQCETCGRTVPVRPLGHVPRFCRPSHAPRKTKHAPLGSPLSGRAEGRLRRMCTPSRGPLDPSGAPHATGARRPTVAAWTTSTA